MTRIGFTGHQGLTGPTRALIADALEAELDRIDLSAGITSLAEGADQLCGIL